MEAKTYFAMSSQNVSVPNIWQYYLGFARASFYCDLFVNTKGSVIIQNLMSTKNIIIMAVSGLEI